MKHGRVDVDPRRRRGAGNFARRWRWSGPAGVDLEDKDWGGQKNVKVIDYPIHPLAFTLPLQFLIPEFKCDYLNFNFHHQNESHSPPI